MGSALDCLDGGLFNEGSVTKGNVIEGKKRRRKKKDAQR
jgi:hypothetical protein